MKYTWNIFPNFLIWDYILIILSNLLRRLWDDRFDHFFWLIYCINKTLYIWYMMSTMKSIYINMQYTNQKRQCHHRIDTLKELFGKWTEISIGCIYLLSRFAWFLSSFTLLVLCILLYWLGIVFLPPQDFIDTLLTRNDIENIQLISFRLVILMLF